MTQEEEEGVSANDEIGLIFVILRDLSTAPKNSELKSLEATQELNLVEEEEVPMNFSKKENPTSSK